MRAFFALLVTLATAASSWEMADLTEATCDFGSRETGDHPQMETNLDQKWFASVPVWYCTHTSKLDLYRTVSEVLKVPINEMKDADLYYDACISYSWTNMTSFTAMGQTTTFEMDYNADGSINWKFNYLDLRGYTTMAKTDNKHYMFFYDCWSDGIKSWVVFTSKPRIPAEAVKEIHDYAESIGFLKEQFTYLRYDTCKLPSKPPGVSPKEGKKEKQGKGKKQKEHAEL